MTVARPPRLKDGDLGAILRAESAHVSPARIADNGSRIKALIAVGATSSISKVSVVVALIVAVAAVPKAIRGAHDDSPEHAAVAVVPADAALADPERSDAAANAADITTTESVPAPRSAPARRATRVVVTNASTPAHIVVTEASAPTGQAASELPAEIRLYSDARTAANAGDYATAVARLDELFGKYPATPLRADAELARADALARGNHGEQAAVAFAALARDDVHRGRRGEILRTLGDLYRQQGDCVRASDAYARALAERLDERDRAAAARGRAACERQ